MTDRNFFQKYQKQLVWLAKVKIGRLILGFDTWINVPKEKDIVGIYPNSIVWKNKNGSYTHTFWEGNCFSDRLKLILKVLPTFSGFDLIPRFSFGLTITEYNPAAATAIDDRVSEQDANAAWATIRAAAGTVGGTGDGELIVGMLASATTNQYERLF